VAGEERRHHCGRDMVAASGQIAMVANMKR
jgi:hypothetical protein